MISLTEIVIPVAIRLGPSARINRWLDHWIVGDCVSISSLPTSLYPYITRRDFSYGISLFPLISLTSRDLNIRCPACLVGSNYSTEKTPCVMRSLISVVSEASNGVPGVVIIPSFRSLTVNS